MQVLVDEVLDPFYIFQFLCGILWISEEYYAYAYCILLISAGSVLISLNDTLSNNETIRKMATYSC